MDEPANVKLKFEIDIITVSVAPREDFMHAGKAQYHCAHLQLVII